MVRDLLVFRGHLYRLWIPGAGPFVPKGRAHLGLGVLGGAEYREPEAAWAVPLAYGDRIVAHVKVSVDGGTLLQDHRVADEVRRFGR